MADLTSPPRVPPAVSAWLGDMTNWVALLASALFIVELIRDKSALVLFLPLSVLLVLLLLKNADVRRFGETSASPEGIPPLGLARGSVRALLALGLLTGFGLYIYAARSSS